MFLPVFHSLLFLIDTSNAIVCYNQTNANSSAWLVTNMASFLSSTSDVDLMHFANDTMVRLGTSCPRALSLSILFLIF